jgi:hypothetical protein
MKTTTGKCGVDEVGYAVRILTLMAANATTTEEW